MALFIVTKICKKCNSELPILDFHKTRQCRFGVASNCKPCVITQARQYLKIHGNERNQKRRERYQTDSQYVQEIKTRGLRYREADRDRYNSNVRKWRAENREKYIKSNRNWQLKHPEQYRASIKRWEKENAEKMLEVAKRAQHRRRLHLANARCDFTYEQWEDIKAFYRNRCAFCNRKAKLTQDHVIPVSKGGDHTASNIIPLCGPCNSSKGNRPITKAFQPHLYMV